MKKLKALYFFVGRSSFVDKDTEMFSEKFIVQKFNFEFEAKWKIPFQLISQFLFLLIHIFTSQIVIIQLAGFHSVLPVVFAKLTGKRSVIIAAGTDCHSFPSIGYGNYQKWLLSIATKFSFKNCNLIIPKHESLWLSDYTYDSSDYDKQGISYFIPGINTPHIVVENGFDSNRFKKTVLAKKNSFITISGLLNRESQRKLKGIDLIIEVAKSLPECSFTILGVTKDAIFSELPTNIKLVIAVPNNELPDILSEHQFYLQLSMAEGFPNALCEAMLCECIPIGSSVFSIPEIIDDTGYILEKRNSAELVHLIKKIQLDNNSMKGQMARQRICNNYTLSKRKEKLLAILEKY